MRRERTAANSIHWETLVYIIRVRKKKNAGESSLDNKIYSGQFIYAQDVKFSLYAYIYVRFRMALVGNSISDGDCKLINEHRIPHQEVYLDGFTTPLYILYRYNVM